MKIFADAHEWGENGLSVTMDLNFAGIFGANTPIRVLKFATP